LGLHRHPEPFDYAQGRLREGSAPWLRRARPVLWNSWRALVQRGHGQTRRGHLAD